MIFVQFTLFLLIGILLFVYYGDQAPAPPAQRDRIYPEFVWNNLPPGVAGMIIAAILAAAMANLSAALNSLASTTVVDFLRVRGSGTDEKKSITAARFATVVWGVILLGIAIGAAQVSKSVLDTGLKIASVPFGALLGVFLLGVLTKKPGQNAAIAGTIAGLGTVLYLNFYTPVAWSWYVLVGTCVTFGVGLLASLFEHMGNQFAMNKADIVELKRDLGPWAAASIVVGTVIGSGIFLVPKTMIANVGTVEAVFAVWIVGGLLSLAGALSYGELAAAIPEAGGEYAFLREAYGPLWGFIYSWTQMWVAKSGSIATLATGFFLYLTNFFQPLKEIFITIPLPIGPGGGPLEIQYGQIFAIVLILALGWLNYFGVKIGGNVQVTVTVVKVAMISGVILVGLFFGKAHAPRRGHAVAPLTFSGFIAALVAALWAYDGWNNVSMVSSEIKDPQKEPAARLDWRNPDGNRHLSGGELGLFPGDEAQRGGRRHARGGGDDEQNRRRAGGRGGLDWRHDQHFRGT